MILPAPTGRMDFLSRDHQRQAVEKPGAAERRSAAARRAARRSKVPGRRPPAARPPIVRRTSAITSSIAAARLEADWPIRPRVRKRLRRLLLRHATALYLGAIAIATLRWLRRRCVYARQAGGDAGDPGGRRAARPVAGERLRRSRAFSARSCAWCAEAAAAARFFARACPETARTMVIVPTMLTSAAGVDALLEHLEVLALGNLDRVMHFAILSDFADTDTADVPEDAATLERARTASTALNLKFGDGTRQPVFPVSPRPAVESRGAGVDWLGAEARQDRGVQPAAAWRHRHEFLDAGRRPRRAAVGSLLHHARFGHAAAPRCGQTSSIGIIAHPLNQPRFDPRLQRVTEGYGILQPRVSVTMTSAAGSLFARIYAGHTGVDPYTTAVSDVYQDLFDEGIFTGKGLYDVDAFTAALEGRVPENALLSHDLFEGLYARTALVTDIEVVDDYPSSVLAHARRQHRWVRGDWQILRWLFPFVPSRDGHCAQSAADHRPLEDPRQPSPQPPAAGHRAAARRSAGPACQGEADRMDRGRARDTRLSLALPAAGGASADPAAGNPGARVPAHRGRRPEDRGRPRRTSARVHGERSLVSGCMRLG